MLKYCGKFRKIFFFEEKKPNSFALLKSFNISIFRQTLYYSKDKGYGLDGNDSIPGQFVGYTYAGLNKNIVAIPEAHPDPDNKIRRFFKENIFIDQGN